ncbi:hypothetical protein VPH35_120944 [Triticum aestivum]|uniref:Uncharacterized protein n=1 Tax=Triticum turgidum subsp. durum TaxID=4567 RepID=A0A9R0Z272_TRITD|nr:unnamed protein product [Triticum turgidum subsp. durum]
MSKWKNGNYGLNSVPPHSRKGQSSLLVAVVDMKKAMAKNNIFQVIIVFLMVQVCLLMMMAAPAAHAAARPVGYNPVCCPRNIYCCGFGGALASAPAPSIEP